MADINTNDPTQQPTPITPTSVHGITPEYSDTLVYRSEPEVTYKGMFGWPQEDIHAIMTLKILGQRLTWDRLFQVQAPPHVQGGWSHNVSVGTTLSESEQQAWDRTLGVSVGAGWGPFNASLSAQLSQGGSRTIQTQLSSKEGQSEEWKWGPEVPVETCYVGQQLLEVYTMELARFNFLGRKTPADITPEMEDACRKYAAAGKGELPPKVRVDRWSLPQISNRSTIFTLTAFPSLNGPIKSNSGPIRPELGEPID